MATTTKKTNKVIYEGNVLIDLTGDTISESKVLSGYTFHDKTGGTKSGTCTFDSDTSSATVTTSEILSGKTAYARGVKLTGDMPNRGSVTGTITSRDGSYTIAQGYHDGSGKVSISAEDRAKLIPENIRENVTILGQTGTMSGSESENAEDNIDVVPSSIVQYITPSSGYTCLRQVTVKAIPYTEEENSAGGLTVSIG